MTDPRLTKKYRTRDGFEAGIYSVDNGGPYPVHAWRKNHNGSKVCLMLTDELKAIYNEDDDFIEIGRYDHIQIDAKCHFWNHDESPKKWKGYFAGVAEDGRPMSWDGARTSWAERIKIIWAHCEKAEDE